MYWILGNIEPERKDIILFYLQDPIWNFTSVFMDSVIRIKNSVVSLSGYFVNHEIPTPFFIFILGNRRREKVKRYNEKIFLT